MKQSYTEYINRIIDSLKIKEAHIRKHIYKLKTGQYNFCNEGELLYFRIGLRP